MVAESDKHSCKKPHNTSHNIESHVNKRCVTLKHNMNAEMAVF